MLNILESHWVIDTELCQLPQSNKLEPPYTPEVADEKAPQKVVFQRLHDASCVDLVHNEFIASNEKSLVVTWCEDLSNFFADPKENVLWVDTKDEMEVSMFPSDSIHRIPRLNAGHCRATTVQRSRQWLGILRFAMQLLFFEDVVIMMLVLIVPYLAHGLRRWRDDDDEEEDRWGGGGGWMGWWGSIMTDNDRWLSMRTCDWFSSRPVQCKRTRLWSGISNDQTPSSPSRLGRRVCHSWMRRESDKLNRHATCTNVLCVFSLSPCRKILLS